MFLGIAHVREVTFLLCSVFLLDFPKKNPCLLYYAYHICPEYMAQLNIRGHPDFPNEDVKTFKGMGKIAKCQLKFNLLTSLKMHFYNYMCKI